MRRVLIAFICCACLNGTIRGQQAQPQFRSGVSLVTIDVSVLDKDEKPIPGLTAADFEIKLNGKVQPVRALSYIEAKGTGIDASATTIEARGQSIDGSMRKGRQTVQNGAPPGESRVFVLMVDDLSFPTLDGRGMFLSAQRFVSALPPSDVVGFATTSGTTAVNPTLNRAPILSALSTITGQFTDPRTIEPGRHADSLSGPSKTAPGNNDSPDMGPGIMESMQIDDGDQATLKNVIARECFSGDTTQTAGVTVEVLVVNNDCARSAQQQARRTAALTRQSTSRQIASYVSVIKSMAAGGTGIKRLVIVSQGLGLSRDAPTLLAPVALAAAASGVQLTVMLDQPDLNLSDGTRRSVGGTIPVQPDPGLTARRRDDDRTLSDGVHTLADVVGGDFQRIIGSPDPFFDRTASSSSAVYRLGVEEPGVAASAKDYGVSVKVNRPGAIVRVNKRAVEANAANTAPAAASVDEQMASAINNGQPLYNVPISIATALRRMPGSQPGTATQLELDVNVAVPARIKGPLTTMFGLVDSSNQVRTGRKPLDTPADGSNYRLSFAIPVTAGSYKLRIAVADGTGSVGSVESPLDAALQQMGPFLASDLLTSWTDANGKSQFLAIEDVPGNVKTLNASLELYPSPNASPAAPPADEITVQFGLYQRGKSEAIASKEIEPEAGEGFIRAGTDFPLADLAPGTYILRATVTVAGKELGTTQATLRKR